MTLATNGKAKLTSYSRRKLKIMVKANRIVWTFTNDNMTKKEKLKKAFEYTKKHLRGYNMGGFRKGTNWDLTYAEIVFYNNRGGSREAERRPDAKQLTCGLPGEEAANGSQKQQRKGKGENRI